MTRLDIIGASFGRTGTTSVRLALETLGFGPCHYMRHLFTDVEHARDWMWVADGNDPNWDVLLSGFASTIAWPASCYWRELAEAFPDAKVLLIDRDPVEWYGSVSRTLYRTRPRTAVEPRDKTIERLIWSGVFDGRFSDPQHAMDVYRAHRDEVRATIPADRLVDVDVAAGWPPLCEALGVAVPDEPFPHANSTGEYLDRARSAGAVPN
ncbi:sulfotransferase family protein [Stackebrandtia nassauensis]|uniref:Sulfotransferase family protein n=1 Tax=Stackebrandtia nassauensis (strain DSM 44728 / CIP 108903 / NRRL B-16338 / NBRC 102104 / LLR-40K-21) TaxID=446470 RepID=D3Q793_STANL|nr:sulfotransferase family protein [Stackebrandtia nassauensis]ADD42364.1 conserved hypothetical protein [Stackebrandtia nassauensis DSM 44728]